MSGTVDFRLLSDSSDWLDEALTLVYALVAQYKRISVLCADNDLLEAINEQLWRNAKAHFVTFAFADEPGAQQVNVTLTSEVRHAKRTPALLNINYLLDSSDLSFRHVSELVLSDPETVDKARRQYKMYRSSGYRITHQQLD